MSWSPSSIRSAAHRHVSRRRATHVLHRGVPPDHLLGGNRHVGRARAQRLLLLGVLDQLQHAAAEHVPGRLVAADQDEQHLLDDRLVVEAHTVDLGLAQGRDHVVAGVLPPIRDDLQLRLTELHHRAARALQPLRDLLRGDHLVVRSGSSSPRTTGGDRRTGRARSRGGRRSRRAAAAPRCPRRGHSCPARTPG